MIKVQKDRFIKSLFLALILFGIFIMLLVNKFQPMISSGTQADLSIIVGNLMIINNLYCFYCLAKAKGYSGWLSLMAFLQILGLLILLLLKDKTKRLIK